MPDHQIRVARLNEDAILPTRAHPGDAGLDLHATTTAYIPAGTRRTLHTGIAVAIPEGHVGLVFPRSSMGFKYGIQLSNGTGVIDAGYRGEIKLNVINHDHTTRFISRGERIAQLVITPIVTPTVLEVHELDDTPRGANGIGSTGA